MEKEKETLKDYFNQIREYSNLKLKLKNITSTERYDISNFKLKYLLLQLDEFKDEKKIEDLITLSQNIIDLKK